MAEHYHFIGIGGSGMSVLALALLDQGAVVSGSDLGESTAVEQLRERGIHVTIGQTAANPDLPYAETVVISAAVNGANDELQEAQRLGKPVIKRAELLGRLMDTRNGIAVAGTAGKTTTTAMIAWILHQAQRDPSFMVGSVLPDLGVGGYWGSGPDMVAEADEYDRSFWHLRPEVAVVTNLEAEHLDIYGDLAGVRDAFVHFANNTRGAIFCCADDAGSAWLADELIAQREGPEIRLYGLTNVNDWQATDLQLTRNGGTAFRVLYNGAAKAIVQLRLPGRHNVQNALAAFAVADYLAVPADVTAAALSSFSGTQRRFQHKGVVNDVTIIDDYAHHPTKIRATLAAARLHMPESRLLLVFQPHTYSRTRDFLDDFGAALDLADDVIILPIYASRETDTLGLTGHELPDMLNERTPGKARFAANLDQAAAIAVEMLRPGDVVITMGAGDVSKVSDLVLQKLASGVAL